MVQTRYAVLLELVAPLAVAAIACTTSPSAGTAPSASASVAPPAASEAPRPAPRARDDEEQPVYPRTPDPPDPIAQRYCDLVHEVAEKTRASCCPKTPFSPFRPTGECVRTLSYALRSKAVVIKASDLDACEAATREEAKRCDWGGSMPPACKGILHGEVPADALCRSSLECKEGLFCAGLGTTRPGKCRPSLPEGARCGGASDTLGAFVRQDPEPSHPQCQGYCGRRRCEKTAAVGQACVSSIACGHDRTCVDGKCSDAPLPAEGQPCKQKRCGAGLACVKGTCLTVRRLDEPCASDEECRSAYCERADGGPGKCAMRCEVIRTRR